MHRVVDKIFTSSLLILAGIISTVASEETKEVWYSLPSKSNPLGINYAPAPPPEFGPPLSAHALRDPKYLPAEIGGIVGAYVLVVASALIALWTVGTRLRREKRLSRRPTDVELAQAPYSFQYQEQYLSDDRYPEHFQEELQKSHYYPSPISPTPISSNSAAKNFSWPSPEKADKNPYIFPTNRAISPVGSDPSVDIQVVQADRENLQRGLEDIYAHVMAQEAAKEAGVELPAPSYRRDLPAVAPQRLKKSDKSRPSTLDVEESKKQSRTSSIISALTSPRKKKTHELQISSPILTPLSNTFPANYASDEEPLSPRYYSPPPPPAIPMDQIPYNGSRTSSTDPSPISPARSIAEQLQNPRSMPFQHRVNPSQSSIGQASTVDMPLPSPRQAPHPIQTDLETRRNPLAANPLPPIKTQNNNSPLKTQNNSAAASTRTLPFRAFDPPPGLASPSFSQTTKTTVLERMTPLSPGLRTPWTAGAVPYSPYQPQTPLMPISPRLVTKDDRKRMRKQEKRAPVMDMIKSDDELWDSGY